MIRTDIGTGRVDKRRYSSARERIVIRGPTGGCRPEKIGTREVRKMSQLGCTPYFVRGR